MPLANAVKTELMYYELTKKLTMNVLKLTVFPTRATFDMNVYSRIYGAGLAECM
jgi:hypothetical protein